MHTFRLLLICLATITSMAQASQDEWRQLSWQLKKSEEGIEISTAKMPQSKYNAIYGKMSVKGSVNSIVALVLDVDKCSSWADLCKESRIVKRLSPTEFYVYTYNNVPFPVTDRYVVAHVNWQQDPSTLQVRMLSKPIEGEIEKENAVKIKEADSRWYFTPQADGSTLVETFAHVNPNGPIPAWLSNLLQVNSPFKTMKSMRQLIEDGAYQDAESIF